MEQERNEYKKKSEEFNKRLWLSKQEINCLKARLKHQIKVDQGLRLKLEQQRTQMNELKNMTLISEEMRKTFSEQLRESLVRDEASRNENFNQNMNQQIQGHSIQFLQEQFKLLFDSVNNISADKKLGDRL